MLWRTGLLRIRYPQPRRRKLINQRYRAQLNRLFVSDKNITLVAEVKLPAGVGSFGSARSACRMPDGMFVAVSNCPPATGQQWKVAVRGPEPWGEHRASGWRMSSC